MTYLTVPANPGFPDVYQIEVLDRVKGGPGGIANLQATQLAERTAFLKKQIDDAVAGALTFEYANRLKTARTITMTGDGSWFVSFDGSGNVTAAMTLTNTGVAAGTYPVVTVDSKGRVTAARALQSADLPANAALTGAPTAPTAAPGTNTTQLANTAFVQAAIAALVASSPAALDTLNELAAALGNDANFATTMTNALAGKMPVATQVIATSAALDALRTSGFYIVFGANGDGQVLHIQHPQSNTYAAQLMFGQWGQVPATSGVGLSYRALVSGVWTPWQRIWHAGNFDPQTQSVTAFTTAGASPAFTLAPSPAITAYAANQRFRVKFHAAGGGADTLNISGLGAKSLKQYDSTGAKVAAVIAANQLTDVEYDGVDMVILDPLPSARLPAGIPLDWIGLTPPSWAVVRDGSALTRASYTGLFAALCTTRSGTLTSGQNTVTGLSTTLDMWIGMPIEGTGVPAGTTVGSITGTTSITLSANSTASGAQTLTLFPFGYGSGGSATTFGVPDDRGLHTRAYDSGRGYEQSTLTANTNSNTSLTGISSTRGLYVGMPVSGAGIPASTTISQINSAASVTISNAATATATAVALTVTGRQIGAEGVDEIKSHAHAPLSPQTGFYGPGGSGTSIPTGATSWSSQTTTANTGGPENNVKRRVYLPIITTGA